MIEKVTGELTQTRRDVRSESISATCIVEFGLLGEVVEEVECLNLGERLELGIF